MFRQIFFVHRLFSLSLSFSLCVSLSLSVCLSVSLFLFSLSLSCVCLSVCLLSLFLFHSVSLCLFSLSLCLFSHCQFFYINSKIHFFNRKPSYSHVYVLKSLNMHRYLMCDLFALGVYHLSGRIVSFFVLHHTIADHKRTAQLLLNLYSKGKNIIN